MGEVLRPILCSEKQDITCMADLQAGCESCLQAEELLLTSLLEADAECDCQQEAAYGLYCS